MGDDYLLRPSAAASTIVARVEKAMWACDPTGAGAAQWVVRAARRRRTPIRDVLGHPTRPLLAVVEDQDAAGDAQQVRIFSAHGAEDGVVVHRADGAVRLAGWWADDVLLLSLGVGGGARPPEVVLRRIGDRADSPATVPAAVAWADHTGDGRVVLTTFGPRPEAWAGHRGGGAGRVLVHDPATGDSRELPHTGNAADAVVLGQRVYWIDDHDGPANVYSLPLDPAPADRPVRHTGFRGIGATSLRRGPGRLVVGSLGRVWSLVPGRCGRADELTELRGNAAAVAPDRRHHDTAATWRSAVERVVTGSTGRVAVLAAGSVCTPDGVRRALDGGWVVDAAWSAVDGLLTLEHHDGRAVVVAEESARSVWTVARGDGASDAQWLAHAGGTTAIAGETFGVYVLTSGAGARRIDDGPAHRRSRPVLSPDGALVAWTEEQDLQGGRLVLHDVRAGAVGVLALDGTHLSSPVFGADGRLVLLARRVSTAAGTAVPLENGWVLQADTDGIFAGASAGAVRETWPAAVPLHELALVDGVPWARAGGGRWHPVDGTGEACVLPGTPLPGSTVPAALDSGGVMAVLGAGGRTYVLPALPATAAPDPRHVVAETVRQVRRVRTVLAAPEAEDLAWEAQGREAAERVGGEDALLDLLTVLVGRAGLSHSVVMRAGPRSAPDLADALSARTEAALAGVARTLSLRDVSVRGWQEVEHLIRSWRGDGPLVLDLRFNEGGQFADALAALLVPFLLRSATAWTRGDTPRALIPGPRATAVLVGECTGSGGEHLAALLQGLPGVTLWGRRTAGAGTGFHRTRSLGGGLRLALPQYRLGGTRRDLIENHGVVPDIEVPADHTAGHGFDDLLTRLVMDSLTGAATVVAPATRKENKVDQLSTVAGR